MARATLTAEEQAGVVLSVADQGTRHPRRASAAARRALLPRDTGRWRPRPAARGWVSPWFSASSQNRHRRRLDESEEGIGTTVSVSLPAGGPAGHLKEIHA